MGPKLVGVYWCLVQARHLREKVSTQDKNVLEAIEALKTIMPDSEYFNRKQQRANLNWWFGFQMNGVNYRLREISGWFKSERDLKKAANALPKALSWNRGDPISPPAKPSLSPSNAWRGSSASNPPDTNARALRS
jgi:hypothetical protein